MIKVQTSTVHARQARRVWHKDLLDLWCKHSLRTIWNVFHRETNRGRRSESGLNIVRFKKTRFNITTDNFFCSVSLAHCLLETLLWRLYNRTRQTSLLWWGLGLAWIQRQHYHGQLCQKERNSCSTYEHNVSQQMVDENTRKEKITHSTTRPKDVDTMDQMVDTYTCKCKT